MNQLCPAIPAAWHSISITLAQESPHCPQQCQCSWHGHPSPVPSIGAAAGEWQGQGMCWGVKEAAQEAQHLPCCPRDSWSSQNLLSIPRGKQTASSSLKIAAQGTRSRLREGEVKRKMGCSFPGNSPQPCSPAISHGCIAVFAATPSPERSARGSSRGSDSGTAEPRTTSLWDGTAVPGRNRAGSRELLSPSPKSWLCLTKRRQAKEGQRLEDQSNQSAPAVPPAVLTQHLGLFPATQPRCEQSSARPQPSARSAPSSMPGAHTSSAFGFKEFTGHGNVFQAQG